MKTQQRRLLFWGGISIVLVVILAFSFSPKPVVVDLYEVKQGLLQVTISDEAKTRVHDIYTLSAPISGQLKRIDAEVGDPVLISKTIVAQIEPVDSEFLDPRTEAQVKADIQTAESAESVAKAVLTEAEVELDFALKELKRARELRLSNNVSKRELENTERAYKARRAALATAQASLQMRQYQLKRVKAQLLSPTKLKESKPDCECLDITAPVDGNVLKILNKSEGVVSAGTPLVQIGNPKNLEIVVELLSSDAVQVAAGQRVIIENWGGAEALEGIVTLVEPIGFTKVSALGIEEQRVNVIVNFTSPQTVWSRLGHGYQVDVKVVLWEGEVLKVPTTALFRDGEQWAVYVEKNNKVEKREIKIGRKNSFEVELVDGVMGGERIILHPSNKVVEGVEIVSR